MTIFRIQSLVSYETVPFAGNTSDWIHCQGNVVIGVMTPPGGAAGALTWEVRPQDAISTDAFALNDLTGAPVSTVIAPGTCSPVSPYEFMGATYVRMTSSSAQPAGLILMVAKHGATE